jgi:hypothetical protein
MMDGASVWSSPPRSRAGGVAAVTFVQIIEFTTSRADEVDALLDQWLAGTEGKRTATRGVQSLDRDRPNTYVHVVEFPSYEAAMANSELPETGEVAARLAELADGPPTFRNLDAVREWDSGG